MKREFKSYLIGVLVLAALVCGTVVTAQAQKTPNDFVIYARAGRINIVSGGVTLQRAGERTLSHLTANTELSAGDVVRTDDSGRTELLLNPGSYLRAGENSEFEIVDTALENVHIKLLKGSAVIEASGISETRLPITISTPQGRISIPRNGLYRINVSSGTTELMVRKGRAIVNDAYATLVREGQKAILGSGAINQTASASLSTGGTQLVKFNKSAQDALDLWSMARANTLIALNRSVARDVRNSWLASYNDVDWPMVNFPGRSGIWIYNAQTGCYIFMAFYRGFSSPYGYGYPGLLGYPCNSCYIFPYGGGGGGGYSGGYVGGSSGGHGS